MTNLARKIEEETTVRSFVPKGNDKPRVIELVNAASLAGRPAPPREWHVEDLIPGNQVTLLMGDGATGKSLLALQLAAATARGTPWLGKEVKAGRVIFLTAEDELDEVHRRLNDIAQAEGFNLAELDDLDILPLAGRDAVLALPERSGVLGRTPLFNAVEEKIAERPTALVILDTLADVFAGDEINRAQARQFIGMIRGWAITHRLAALILGHPSLTGMAGGTGSSGSTGWRNSARGALYFQRVIKPPPYAGASPEEPDVNARILHSNKPNYATKGVLHLTYSAGRFVPAAGIDVSSILGINPNARAEEIFLELLAKYTEQGRHVSPLPSTNFAPKVFEDDAGAKGFKRNALKAAMNRLLDARKIKVGKIGRASRQTSCLVLASHSEQPE